MKPSTLYLMLSMAQLTMCAPILMDGAEHPRELTESALDIETALRTQSTVFPPNAREADRRGASSSPLRKTPYPVPEYLPPASDHGTPDAAQPLPLRKTPYPVPEFIPPPPTRLSPDAASPGASRGVVDAGVPPDRLSSPSHDVVVLYPKGISSRAHNDVLVVIVAIAFVIVVVIMEMTWNPIRSQGSIRLEDEAPISTRRDPVAQYGVRGEGRRSEWFLAFCVKVNAV
ncbi:uncharacterized protein B0T15DRAFT_507433 [Chaetomium strumarium]|uniref:Transmembrane protein n=1 Tax=Chaetomium strumarium TaxID=1170767 RepID=A0AAJ0H2T3_9PEZI|nr:hypothetical protein B0T15DRAFT_507433 [Chaetomium strumarium]